MRAAAAVFACLIATGATPGFGQRPEILQIRATRHDTITAASTVTATFAVRNTTGDIVHVSPALRTPSDWPVLMGATPFAMAPKSSSMLMLSLVVPARAAAGTYVLAVSVGGRAVDSVFVRVPPRRAIDVTLLDRPGYVVAGQSYTVHFQLRNRGNYVTRVRTRARSSLGRVTAPDSVLRLASGESAILPVRIETPHGLSAATDDVLEVSAKEDSVSDVRIASARVTVVPEPTRAIEEYLRIPTQVNLRAASTDAVSPFEVFGRGTVVDGGDTEVDFLFRGPTGPFSAFGERDEYRVSMASPSWRARIGDQLYMLSPLTAAAQPGFGVGVDGTRGPVSAGAHAQRFRRSLVSGREIAAFVGVGSRAATHAALNVVHRDGGILPGDVVSARGAFAGEGLWTSEGEIAMSRAAPAGSRGLAHSIRLSRAGGTYSIDLGHHRADTAFGGPQRGARHSHVSATAHWLEPVSFALTGGSHRADLSRTTGVPYIDAVDVGTLGATWLGRYTMELGVVTRGTTIAGARQGGAQHGIRLRADHDASVAHFAAETELGRARDVGGQHRGFTDVSLSARRPWASGYMSLWTERYSGGSITRGSEGTVTVGVDASRRVGAGTDLTFIGYATQVSAVNAPWQSQVDVMLSKLLRNGGRIGLRARLIGGGTLTSSQQSVAYLEYGMPLRLPVSRLRTPGRVYGRVVDAVSGRGVPGALVRLGPQVAITDADGHVAFGGVPGGEHRLSMSQETTFADAVFVGDPTVRVDSARAQPTTFTLAIAQSARLDIDVRRFIAVRTGVAGVPDSLADAGGVGNATLVLAGDRDTLYRTTLADGKATFTDVPPGRWVIFVRGDAPAFHRFDPDRMELTLAPGASQSLRFHLIPRKREVQLIGDEQELRSEPAPKPPAGGAPAAPRTRKPGEHPPKGR